MKKVTEMKSRIDSIRGMKPVIHEGDGTINWQELAEVYAETLDELCNDLWQLVHPGADNNWSMPAEVYEAVKEALAIDAVEEIKKLRQHQQMEIISKLRQMGRPREVNVKADYLPPQGMKVNLGGILNLEETIRNEVERKLQAIADGKEEL